MEAKGKVMNGEFDVMNGKGDVMNCKINVMYRKGDVRHHEVLSATQRMASVGSISEGAGSATFAETEGEASFHPLLSLA